MSYIGVAPTAGQYRNLDDISGSFNGSTTTFTTAVSGQNVTAGVAQQLLVSLGGVVQKPGTDYTVGTNSITFTTAPSSGLSFFGILMGEAVNVGTPSDGTVTSAKLASDLTVDLASGTVSAPSLSFDSNTGLYSTADNEVAITTDGTYRAKVDSSGRLLVGTSSTSANTSALFQGIGGSPTGAAQLRVALGSTTPATNDALGYIIFSDSGHSNAAWLAAHRDGGTWTSGSSQPTRLVFSTTADGASSPTQAMLLSQDKRFYLSNTWYNNSTTANAANVHSVSNGEFYRSTSSIKYKTDVETIQDSYADAILNVRPVWYRSTCQHDNPAHSWWGFIAEEVADVDPRLVQWKTVDVTYDENGSPVETPCDPEPEGVAYDRFVPHLLNLIKRQKEQIESQATQLASFEARLAALEAQ